MSSPRSFKESLFDPDEFTLTFELVPNRGGKGTGQNRVLSLARKAAEDGRLRAVSITENAGGHPALSPEVLGIEIRAMGLDVINHFSCKDKNRNQIESLLFAWDRQGFSNLLVLSGDYPKKGYHGHPKPVFDLGSILALDMISRMNRGTTQTDQQTAAPALFQPTSFLKGVAVSPFKIRYDEQLLQYLKLQRKVSAGADYAITQLGYDARKFHELLCFMRQRDITIPVLGNVFVPNIPVTKMMYRAELPGCVIPEPLYQQIMQEASSPDKGKKARLFRAAQLLSVLKGLGYSGAHIGGPGLTFDDIRFILDEATVLEDTWQDQLPQLSYWSATDSCLFRQDTTTGLNDPDRSTSLPHMHHPGFHFHLARKSHEWMFEKKGLLYPWLKKLCFAAERYALESQLDICEFLIKRLLFTCQNCGDCRLADLGYLCPQSGCAKFLLNGPCGGSHNGWCEVYPGKKRCLYVRLAERFSPEELEHFFSDDIFPPRDWSLNGTSSWLNFFRQKARNGA